MPAPLSRRLVVVLGALSAFGPLSVDMYLPALPQIGRTLNTSASSVQLTLTACTLGLGAGQLVAGPLSDVHGRRRPLLAGLVAFLVFSVGCALAPNLPVLLVCRFLQALGGAAGLVISRAVARDLRSGPALARLFAGLVVVNGAAPVLAPVIGGQLIRVTSWRGVFVVLAVIGAFLLVASALIVPETLPVARRRASSVRLTFATYAMLLRDRTFVLYAATTGVGFAAMFAYISGSPFVLEEVHGLSAQLFSLDFGTNAVGLIASSLLARRLAPAVAMRLGLSVGVLGAALVLTSVLAGVGLIVLLPGFFLITSGYGAVSPNVTALALSDHPDVAGSASAVLGAAQFLTGGLIGPLVGVGGTRTALPLGLVVAVTSVTALTIGLRSIARAARP